MNDAGPLGRPVSALGRTPQTDRPRPKSDGPAKKISALRGRGGRRGGEEKEREEGKEGGGGGNRLRKNGQPARSPRHVSLITVATRRSPPAVAVRHLVVPRREGPRALYVPLSSPPSTALAWRDKGRLTRSMGRGAVSV